MEVYLRQSSHSTFDCFNSLFLDVTIYEHANSNVTANRLRKGNLVVKEKGFDAAVEELVIEVEDVEETGFKRRRNRRSNLNETDNNSYNDYHVDIWSVISEHIRPEDVSRFALICKKTSFIVSSAKFWLALYRKHYRRQIDMPNSLRPESMRKLSGIRSNVIRSLFYTYPPLVRRLNSNASKDYHYLVKRECINMWNSQQKDGWIFCFKFKQKMMPGSRCAESDRVLRTKKVWEVHQDVYSNSEEGCQILVVRIRRVKPFKCFHFD